MNKIKFLYDVVKAMREKDIWNGVATAEVQKNQAKVFFIKNEFEKNLLTMQTKATITTEIDYEGKQVNHNSTTEFTNHSPCQGHKLFRHMHHAGSCCKGLRRKLSKLAFALNLLDSIQLEEQENSSTLISLEINEIPEDIKTLLQEKVSQVHSSDDVHPHSFMRDICCTTEGNLSLAISVNKEYQIEKTVLTFDGIQNSANQEEHKWSIVANLQLN